MSAPLLPLSLEEISLVRGHKRVLKDITHRFGPEPGKTLIVGPNGAGKSLLLQVCHGLVAPDAGQVVWAGRAADPSMLKRQAMVFQRPVMLRRTAEANVAFPLRLRGLPRGELRSRVERLFRQTGLTRSSSAWLLLAPLRASPTCCSSTSPRQASIRVLRTLSRRSLTSSPSEGFASS